VTRQKDRRAWMRPPCRIHPVRMTGEWPEENPRWGSTVAFHVQRVVLGESFAERHAVEIPAAVAPLAVLLWEAFGAHYGHEIGEA